MTTPRRRPKHRNIAHHVWCFAVKRKMLTFLSAALLGAAGLAGEQLYSWAVKTYHIHQNNAVAVPRLEQEMLDARNQITVLDNYMKSDVWRWRRQTNLNATFMRK